MKTNSRDVRRGGGEETAVRSQYGVPCMFTREIASEIRHRSANTEFPERSLRLEMSGFTRSLKTTCTEEEKT